MSDRFARAKTKRFHQNPCQIISIRISKFAVMHNLARAAFISRSPCPVTYISGKLRVRSKGSLQASNGPATGGNLDSNVLARTISSYSIHPEKLKRMCRELDVQALCNYFDSEVYKTKVGAVVTKTQRQNATVEAPGVNEHKIIYEHVLNCAQPPKPKPKVEKAAKNLKKPKKAPPSALVSRRKCVKTTIMSVMLKKKNALSEKCVAENLAPPRIDVVTPEVKKRHRKRSAIMPIYLKRMQENKRSADNLPRESADTLEQECEGETVEIPVQGEDAEAKLDHRERRDESKDATRAYYIKWANAMQKMKQRSNKLGSRSEAILPEVPCELDGAAEAGRLSQVAKRNMSTCQAFKRTTQEPIKENGAVSMSNFLSLFERVKLNTSNKPLSPIEKHRYHVKAHAKKYVPPRSPSLTYKLVTDNRRRMEQKIREKYGLTIPLNLGLGEVKSPDDNVDDILTHPGESFDEDNFYKRLRKPPDPYVDVVRRSEKPILERFTGSARVEVS